MKRPSLQTGAFIEINTEEAANTMVNYHTTVAPMLRGRPHKELKTPSLPNQLSIQVAL